MPEIIQRRSMEQLPCGNFRQLPIIVACDCGRKHTIEPFEGDNNCECGQEYNAFGQALAPRSQWGHETGESLAEIYSGRAGEDY